MQVSAAVAVFVDTLDLDKKGTFYSQSPGISTWSNSESR